MHQSKQPKQNPYQSRKPATLQGLVSVAPKTLLAMESACLSSFCVSSRVAMRCANSFTTTVLTHCRLCFPRVVGRYNPAVVIQTHTEILDAFAEQDAAASWAARGRKVASYVSLVAFTGTHSWPPVRTLRMLANVLGSNYPERTHSTVVYPVANWVRLTLNALLAVFVDPVTRGKIHFCSTLAEACQWLEVADPHSLPSSVSDAAAIEALLKEQEAAEAGEEGAAAAAAVQEAT